MNGRKVRIIFTAFLLRYRRFMKESFYNGEDGQRTFAEMDERQQ